MSRRVPTPASSGAQRPRRDNLREALLHACRQDPVLGVGGGPVVVALSGGPDSSALLHGLAAISRGLRLELTAVHVDHRLRPRSAADARAAEAFSDALGVRFEVQRPAIRGRGEEAWRRARHAALEQAAGRLGANTIALGHTADDQAETILLHLVRGSGLEGLAAMAPREGMRFRPLLGVWRVQVEAYCRVHGMNPRRDESNDDSSYLRNRARQELLPLLESRFNPGVKEALVRLGTAARQEHDAVVEAARRWRRRHRGALPRDAFNRLPEAVRIEVLRSAWSEAAGLARPAGDAARLQQAVRLARREGPGMIQLGGGLELVAGPADLAIRAGNRSHGRRTSAK